MPGTLVCFTFCECFVLWKRPIRWHIHNQDGPINFFCPLFFTTWYCGYLANWLEGCFILINFFVLFTTIWYSGHFSKLMWAVPRTSECSNSSTQKANETKCVRCQTCGDVVVMRLKDHIRVDALQGLCSCVHLERKPIPTMKKVSFWSFFWLCKTKV